MLRILAVIAVIVMLFSRVGLFPTFDKDAIIRCYDTVISTLAKLSLTHEPWLIGERELSDQSGCYGEYICEASDVSGSDFVFGGASVYEKRIKLTAERETLSGSAELKIIIAGETKTCHFDKNGRFEEIFTLSGASGVTVEYERFTSRIRITSEEE